MGATPIAFPPPCHANATGGDPPDHARGAWRGPCMSEGGRRIMHGDQGGGRSSGLRAWLDDADLTPGQRKRLSVFQSVEAPVCARIEEVCGSGGVEVTDVAVLVIAKEARRLFFDDDSRLGVSVVIGHRSR